jgi:uncharacterized membrane protein
MNEIADMLQRLRASATTTGTTLRLIPIAALLLLVVLLLIHRRLISSGRMRKGLERFKRPRVVRRFARLSKRAVVKILILGFMVLGPIPVTVLLTVKSWELIWGWISPHSERLSDLTGINIFCSTAALVLLSLLLLLLVGLGTKYGFGRAFRWVDRLFTVYPVYRAVKSFFRQALSVNQFPTDRPAVYIEGGRAQPCFMAETGEGSLAMMWRPSSPSPSNGFLSTVELSSVIELTGKITPTEMMSIVVGMGMGSRRLLDLIEKEWQEKHTDVQSLIAQLQATGITQAELIRKFREERRR